LAGNRRVQPFLNAKGFVTAKVKAQIDGTELDAKINANVDGFKYESIDLRRASVYGTARGDLRHPDRLRIDLKLNGEG
jgi:hypothetical protein